MAAQYRTAHDGIYGSETFGQIFAGQEYAPLRALKYKNPSFASTRFALAGGKATADKMENLFRTTDPPSPRLRRVK